MARLPHVRVRRGRRGLELRIDGTLASWYRPGDALTGGVWDALGVPALLVPSGRRPRVLILGLGGGSAARLVRALAPAALIVGVELDAEVVAAARALLDLDATGVEVAIADARAFLGRERRSFDLVIEDVFEGDTRWLRKPGWMVEEGYRLAAQRLAPGGVLATNTVHETARVMGALRTALPGRTLSIDVADHVNRILVRGTGVPAGATLRRLVAAHPLLAGRLGHLAFRSLPR